MKFLAVLIIIFLYRNWMGGNPLRSRVPFVRYVAWFKQRGVVPNVRYVLCVGLPVALALFISLHLGGWFLGVPWLVFALAVLIYSVDIYDEDVAFDEHLEWLGSLGAGDDLATAHAREQEFRLVTTYEIFQSLYPSLFWFLILGPAAALAYVLSRLYLDNLEDEDPELRLVEQVVYWMEWPAARLTGLVFALLGHFGKCFEEWIATLTDTRESIGIVLVRLAGAALGEDSEAEEADSVDTFASRSETANNELRGLLDRALFGWLGVAAIVAILGL